MTDTAPRPRLAALTDPQLDESPEWVLAGLVLQHGGELRLPRHYLDRWSADGRLVISLDPVTDDVVIRIR